VIRDGKKRKKDFDGNNRGVFSKSFPHPISPGRTEE
jgi:hypothetical protein